MKKITFILSLVSASLTVTAAAAVQNQYEIVELPSYTVKTARYTDAEKAVAASLAELRAQARPTNAVRAELPSFNTVAQQQSGSQPTRSLASLLAARVPARS